MKKPNEHISSVKELRQIAKQYKVSFSRLYPRYKKNNITLVRDLIAPRKLFSINGMPFEYWASEINKFNRSKGITSNVTSKLLLDYCRRYEPDVRFSKSREYSKELGKKMLTYYCQN